MRQAVLVAGWSLRCAARRPIRTIGKAVIPPAILLVLVVLRVTMKSSSGCDSDSNWDSALNRTYCQYRPFRPGQHKPFAIRNETLLHYTPLDYEGLVGKVAAALGLEALGYVDEDEMERALKSNETVYSNTLAALVFYTVELNQQSYSIRMKSWLSMWNTERLYPLIPSPAPRANNKSYTGAPFYFESGFLALQSAIDSEITGLQFDNTVSLQKFPHPPYTKDLYLAMIPIVLPLLLLISYGLLAADLVKEVNEQRTRGIKEFMRLNGLTRSAYWVSWFLVATVIFLPTTLLNLLVLYVGNTLVYSDVTVILLFLLLFSLASIAMSFLISCFSTSPMSSMMSSVVIWLIFYAPFFFIESDFQTIPSFWKSVFCVLPPLALGIACRLIGDSEMSEEGLQWSNIADGELGIPFQVVLIVLLLDVVVLTCLAVYIDAVATSQFGYPEGWCFCLGCSAPSTEDDVASESTPLLSYQYSNRDYYEKIPRTGRVGVDMTSVMKEYMDGQHNTAVALHNTDIKALEGEITVVLGPNSCGKSTMLAMMAGFVRPTEGEVSVSGIPLDQHPRRAQTNISYMPQTEPLLEDLTVEEHLTLYATLRGLSKREVSVHKEETLHLLGLTPLSDFKAGTLSGGQKRKLSLAIALVCDSSVMILDEPMAGMDIENRSLICSVLERIKSSCTIVLCTHCVDDAIQVADRIAILLNNKLHCYGTPAFVKAGFGIGYTMKLVKGAEGCQTDGISRAVLGAVSRSSVQVNNARELSFSVPRESAKQMATILQRLEQERETLGIESIVISENTLEEAYNQLTTGGTTWSSERSIIRGDKPNTTGLDPRMLHKKNRLASVKHFRTRAGSLTPEPTSVKEIEEFRIGEQQRKPMRVPDLLPPALWASIVKNCKIFNYHWFLSLAMMLLPAVFCTLMFLVLRIGKQSDVTTPLVLWATTYPQTSLPYLNVATNGSSESDLETGLKNTLASSGTELLNIGTADMDTYLLNKEDELGFSTFGKQFVVTEELDETQVYVKARFGDSPLHSAPISLSVAHNTLIAATKGKKSVRTINKPLPLMEGEGRPGSSIALMTLYLMGVSFLVSLSVVLPAVEIASGAKHLQQFSGLKPHFFWLGVYVIVAAISLVSSLLCTLTVLLTEEPAFYLDSRWLLVWLITFLYFLAGLPLSLFIASLCKTPTTAYAVCELVNKGLGFVTVVIFGVFYLDEVDMKEVADILSIIFMFLPSFSAAHAMQSLYKNYNLRQKCNTGVCMEEPASSYLSFTQPGIAGNIAALTLCSVLYLLLLLSFDTLRRKYLRNNKKQMLRVPLVSVLQEERGIVEERERIYSESYQPDSIVVRDLQKCYRSSSNGIVGLNDLTLGVRQGETLGLLGGNGAGKSTTFRILTGEELVHGGVVLYNGVDLRDNPTQPSVGYCPQFPALIPSLSVRQHMILFARIKNQSEDYLVKDIAKIMKVMGLLEVADETVHNLSPGKRKKLGVSLALLGVPAILLLDEPTTGLDEDGKKLVVGLLNRLRDKGTATLITSHNMMESEAICNRIGILSHGSLQCLGQLDALKEKYGNYTIVRVTLEPATQDELDSRMASLGSFINVNFPGAELKEFEDRVVTYAIPGNTDMKWSVLFTKLELNSSTHGIQEYSVSNASLAQVYLSITRQQYESSSLKPRKIKCIV